MKKRISLLAFTFVVFACGSSKLLIPSQGDADRAAQKNKSVTLASLTEGKTIFEQNCNRCHGYKNPTSRSEEKWNKIIPRMTAKVNKKVGKEEIDAKEQELLLQYVMAMSSVTPAK